MVKRFHSVITSALPRPIGAAGFVFSSLILGLAAVSLPARAATALDDRGSVLGAIHDAKAALAEITDAEQNGDSNPDPFLRAAQRAINALVGRHDPSFDAKVGTPGDAAGAIADLNGVLDCNGTFPWTAPLAGAVANLKAAVETFQAALKAHGLMKYEVTVTDAVQDLEMALGRPSEAGPLGGLEGLLSSTEIGVPPGGHRVSACSAPTRGPAYGVYKGYLAHVALPLRPGETRLPLVMGEREVTVARHMLILHSPVAAEVAKLCHPDGAEKSGALRRTSHRKVASAGRAPTADPPAKVAATDPPPAGDPPKASANDPPPAVFTMAQAQAGRKVFMTHCIACHGTNLQGVSAPAVAGKAFLGPVKSNGWNVSDAEYLIATSMPFNAPGTLTPNEQADVLAFILAENCYPSGKTMLSTKEDAVLQHVKLGPLPGVKPSDPALGVCVVK